MSTPEGQFGWVFVPRAGRGGPLWGLTRAVRPRATTAPRQRENRIRPGHVRTRQDGPRRATTAQGAGNAPNPARTVRRGPPRSAPPPPYLPGSQTVPTAPAPRQVNKISHFFDCLPVNKMCRFCWAGARGGPAGRSSGLLRLLECAGTLPVGLRLKRDRHPCMEAHVGLFR